MLQLLEESVPQPTMSYQPTNKVELVLLIIHLLLLFYIYLYTSQLGPGAAREIN